MDASELERLQLTRQILIETAGPPRCDHQAMGASFVDSHPSNTTAETATGISLADLLSTLPPQQKDRSSSSPPMLPHHAPEDHTHSSEETERRTSNYNMAAVQDDVLSESSVEESDSGPESPLETQNMFYDTDDSNDDPNDADDEDDLSQRRSPLVPLDTSEFDGSAVQMMRSHRKNSTPESEEYENAVFDNQRDALDGLTSQTLLASTFPSAHGLTTFDDVQEGTEVYQTSHRSSEDTSSAAAQGDPLSRAPATPSMGDRVTIDLARAERNARYNALHGLNMLHSPSRPVDTTTGRQLPLRLKARFAVDGALDDDVFEADACVRIEIDPVVPRALSNGHEQLSRCDSGTRLCRPDPYISDFPERVSTPPKPHPATDDNVLLISRVEFRDNHHEQRKSRQSRLRRPVTPRKPNLRPVKRLSPTPAPLLTKSAPTSALTSYSRALCKDAEEAVLDACCAIGTQLSTSHPLPPAPPPGYDNLKLPSSHTRKRSRPLNTDSSSDFPVSIPHVTGRPPMINPSRNRFAILATMAVDPASPHQASNASRHESRSTGGLATNTLGAGGAIDVAMPDYYAEATLPASGSAMNIREDGGDFPDSKLLADTADWFDDDKENLPAFGIKDNLVAMQDDDGDDDIMPALGEVGSSVWRSDRKARL